MENHIVLGLSSTLGQGASKKMKTSNSKHNTFSRNKNDNNPDKAKPTKITIKFTLQPPNKSNPKSDLEHSEPENEDALINLKKKKKRKAENEDPGVGIGEEKKMKTKSKTKKLENEDEEESLECVFPTARITRIMKSEGVDCKITAEAVFLVNKATEKFIELFSQDAYDCAVEDHKNFVGYKHLSSAVSKVKLFDFLSDFVPEKVTAEKALAERNPQTTEPC